MPIDIDDRYAILAIVTPFSTFKETSTVKLHNSTHTVDKSEHFEESKFSIEASSKAFFILSDGLYSNKILAVIRELSTNAYDSHIDAGNVETPFDVHLPTRLNPVFFVRDYGTSMDHENCKQLYTTYFRSTRNNSNESVGCLGLGSKAPFAYSDSFTVEAYLNGKCRTYGAYKDVDGSPVFSLMEETDSNEKNGIKVSINVRESDIHDFNREAVKVYEYFKVKPNIIGGSVLTFPKHNKVLCGDTWHFDGDCGGNYIIMGQIAYPITENRLSQATQSFINESTGLKIFVNIGDVDITPSREALSYSSQTISYINNVITNIINEISTKVEQEINTQPTLHKARMKYVDINHQCRSIKSAIEALQKSIMWKVEGKDGIKLFDSVSGQMLDIVNNKNISYGHTSGYRCKWNVAKAVDKMFFKKNMTFIIDNLNRGGLTRIKQAAKEDSYEYTHVYIYKLAEGETVDKCFLHDMLGGITRSEIVTTSSLPPIEYNRARKSDGSQYVPATVKRFSPQTQAFEDCKMSVKYTNAHYLVSNRDAIDVGVGTINIQTLQDTLIHAYNVYPEILKDMNFYILKQSTVNTSKLQGRSNWSCGSKILGDILKQSVIANKQNIMNITHRKQLSTHRKYNNANGNICKAILMSKTNSGVKRLISEYQQYASNITKIEDTVKMISRVYSLCFSNIAGPTAEEISNMQMDEFTKTFDIEIQKYPMLELTDDYDLSRPSLQAVVANYVDSVENAMENRNA